MNQKEEAKRNEFGDMKMPKLPDDFWQKQREMQWKHVFHFKDVHGHFFPVDYDGQPTEKLRPDLPRFNLKTVELFMPPETPPWDDWMQWKGKYEYYLEKYFRPVFANRPVDEGRPLSIDKSKVVLPEERYTEFKAFIAAYSLEKHEDFILFLLCKVEETYIEHVEYYERPEQKEQIRKFPKEVENLIQALKFSDPDKRDRESSRSVPELEQITFHYNTEEPIKITDPILLSSITDATRRSFAERSRKDWEKQLRNFPSVYNDNQQPGEFRYRICKALHNFFKAVDAFNFGTKKTTDAEVYAIAWLLNFAHVKFLSKKGREYDIDTDKYDLRQTVRLHINRKELVYHPTHYTADQMKPDYEKLSKYFDLDFLKTGGSVYNEYTLREVFAITDSFGVNHLFPEIAHIYNCIDQYRFMLGHQMETPFNQEISKNKDYHSLKALIRSLTANGNIEQLQFKLESNQEQFAFCEMAPLEIIKRALLEYYANHRADFEIDLYESSIELNTRDGAFKIIPTGKLNSPSERFLPVFIRKTYDFLLKEAPPGERDWSPSETYYGIISQLLLNTRYFGHQMWDEEVIVQQVKYWHSLSRNAS